MRYLIRQYRLHLDARATKKTKDAWECCLVPRQPENIPLWEAGAVFREAKKMINDWVPDLDSFSPHPLSNLVIVNSEELWHILDCFESNAAQSNCGGSYAILQTENTFEFNVLFHGSHGWLRWRQ